MSLTIGGSGFETKKNRRRQRQQQQKKKKAIWHIVKHHYLAVHCVCVCGCGSGCCALCNNNEQMKKNLSQMEMVVQRIGHEIGKFLQRNLLICWNGFGHFCALRITYHSHSHFLFVFRLDERRYRRGYVAHSPSPLTN